MLHDLKKSHFYDLKLIFLNFPPVPLCSPESRVRFFRSAEAPASVAYIKAGFTCIQQPCLNIRVTIVSPENVTCNKEESNCNPEKRNCRYEKCKCYIGNSKCKPAKCNCKIEKCNCKIEKYNCMTGKCN